MRDVVDILRGTVEIDIECRWPERFMNICAANGVEFFGLRRTGEAALTATMHIGDYRRLRLLAKSGGFTVRAAKKHGAPFFLWNMRRRWALLTALAACVLAVWTSSLFVLEIEVYGNETIPSGKILSALDELGVGIGTMRLSISQEYISNEILQKIPELSWIAVNCTGSRAEVLVREAIPKPDVPDWKIPADIVASKPGIISKMTVLEGARVLTVGDSVLEGEVIVSGGMESLSSDIRYVRASAEVRARTWYDLSAEMPLETYGKRYTGIEKTKSSLVFAGKRINLYFSGGNPYEYCDKITEEQEITLFGGAVLPVKISRDTYTEYEPEKTELSPETAEALLRERLERLLREEIGQNGEIVSLEYSSIEKNGVLTVTLYAECDERIDDTREQPSGYAAQEEPQQYDGEDR